MTEPFNATEQGERDGYAAYTAAERADRPALVERGLQEFEARHALHVRASLAFTLDRLKHQYAEAWAAGFGSAESDLEVQEHLADMAREIADHHLSTPEEVAKYFFLKSERK